MKTIKIYGVSVSEPKLLLAFVSIGIVIILLAANSFSGFSNIGHSNTGSMDMQVSADPAIRQKFTMLSAAHTDVCGDIGNKPAIGKYMAMLPSGSRLQGSCCSPMDMKKYVSQVNGLKKYAYIPQIPQDPYDTSVVSAKQMLGYYDNIQLTPAQQSTFDTAQKMSGDKGWCCCQCWAWYTHAGLAKYLITQHGFNTQQIVEVTNLEDCCGGA